MSFFKAPKHKKHCNYRLVARTFRRAFHECPMYSTMGRYKTWTLDSGLDYGYGLDYGLTFGLDWTVASVLALLFKADYEC